MMRINNLLVHPGVCNQQQTMRATGGLTCCCCLCFLPYACFHLFLPTFFLYLSSLFIFFPLWSLSALLRAFTHIKWRAAVRFQFRTHLWCCRPPTRSAVAEGTLGSPITALYANALAPGQQRGHAGTRSLFMQISGRQSQHRAGHRHRWSYLPAALQIADGKGKGKKMLKKCCKHQKKISEQVSKCGRWSHKVKECCKNIYLWACIMGLGFFLSLHRLCATSLYLTITKAWIGRYEIIRKRDKKIDCRGVLWWGRHTWHKRVCLLWKHYWH